MKFHSLSLFVSAHKEYVTELESVEGSLRQMGENVSAVQSVAVPGLAKWGQDTLDECRSKWDTLGQQVRKDFSLVCIVCCYVLQFMFGRNKASGCMCTPGFVHIISVRF